MVTALHAAKYFGTAKVSRLSIREAIIPRRTFTRTRAKITTMLLNHHLPTPRARLFDPYCVVFNIHNLHRVLIGRHPFFLH